MDKQSLKGEKNHGNDMIFTVQSSEIMSHFSEMMAWMKWKARLFEAIHVLMYLPDLMFC